MTRTALVDSVSEQEIKEKVNTAIKTLFKNDAFLLQANVNERSVAHKFAEYLQQSFLEWNVDCEYDKMDLDTKELSGIGECSEQKKTDRIFPDVIIHHRSTKHNLLVIEIKTKRADCECDYRKLELFTADTGKFSYKLGLFVKFGQLSNPAINWYQNGRVQG